MIYEYIIIGAGASGLFAAATLNINRNISSYTNGINSNSLDKKKCSNTHSTGLILEKTGRAGTKLLMSGNGQCNITHAGNIKSFVDAYGSNGKKIRSCLYKHNNLELVDFLEGNGIKTITREDGKIFPASFNAKEILDLLLRLSEANGFQIRYNSPVNKISAENELWLVTTPDNSYSCRKLIIATGGCSYHRTGSDGSMFTVLERDLGIKIKTPRPALCALKVRDYPLTELAGIAFEDATCTIIHPEKVAVNENPLPASRDKVIIKEKAAARETGGLLLTHKDFSGPAVINISKYAEVGDKLKINYCQGNNYDQVLSYLKSGGKLSDYVPKRFEEYLRSKYGNSPKELAKALTGEEFLITSPGDFNRAMATAGGIELGEINLKTMEFKNHPGLYAIGEALDIDGKTGGYNLQFAWSSAQCISISVQT